MTNEVRIIFRNPSSTVASPAWPAPAGDKPVLPKLDAEGLPLTPTERVEMEQKQTVAPTGPPVIKGPQDAIKILNELKAAYENDINRASEKARVPGLPIPPGSGRWVIASGQTAVDGSAVPDMVAASTIVGAMRDLISDLAMEWKDRPEYLKAIVDRFVVKRTGQNQLFDIMRKDDAKWLTDQDQRHPTPVEKPTKAWDVLVAFSEGRKAELAPAKPSSPPPAPAGPPASPVGGASSSTAAAPTGPATSTPPSPAASSPAPGTSPTAAPTPPPTEAAKPLATKPEVPHPSPAANPATAGLPPASAVAVPSTAAVPTSGLSDGVTAIIKIHKEHSVSSEAETYLAGWIARDRQNGPLMLALVSGGKFEGKANPSSWNSGLQDAAIEGIAEALKTSDASALKIGIDPNKDAKHNELQRTVLFTKWLGAAEKVHASTASESDKAKIISVLKAEVAK